MYVYLFFLKDLKTNKGGVLYIHSFCSSDESSKMNNISNSRNSDYETKQEGSNNESKIVAKPNLTTSSWSRLKDPRIVRVSRAFGGKDRHSKVCTVRGLRDRRVRLSVPTAIQLYDLQDRLGLNQPSKVVDWLLDAAKNEIDELPPLQIPPGHNFGQNLQAMLNASSLEGAKTNPNGLNWEDYWNPDKSKPIMTREANENSEETEEIDERNTQDHNYHNHGSYFQSSNYFLGRNNNSSNNNSPGLLNNVVVPNNSLLKWDPSNLSLSQFGSYGHDHNNFNMNVVAASSIPSGSQVNLLYPPPQSQPPQTQSYFPNSHNSNNFQTGSSSSSSSWMRPFHLSMNPKFFSSEDDDDQNGTGAHHDHEQHNK